MVSLLSGQPYFTFLYKHTKHNIHNREGGRKENKPGLRLAPNGRREKFLTLLCSFLCICGLLRAFLRAKSSRSHQERWLILSRLATRPEATAPALFTWLSSVDCLLLFCSGPLPSLILFRSRRRSRTQALCVGFAPKQTKESKWHSRRQKRMPNMELHYF